MPGDASSGDDASHHAGDTLRVDLATYGPYACGEIAHTLIERDEAIRPATSLAALAALPELTPGGTITAGNAPGINDGACALILADAAYAHERGWDPLAVVVDHVVVGWDPPYLALTPALAARRLLERHALTPAAIDVWEINEAFAAVAVTSAQRLGLEPSVINRRGGAIALGHPIGASGARITASAIAQLRARGGGRAIAAICSGGGQGDALLLATPERG